MPMTLREFAIVCCISALTFSQDSLATDSSQGQETDCDISQGQDLCQDQGNDCKLSCHDPNLEPPAFNDVFGANLVLHQDAATRAPNRLLSTAAVTLRPEDWVKAPEFVPGQMWQFRGKWN